MKFPDNHTAEKTILRLSTDLQCSLIREYTKSISLDDYFSKSLLKDIVNVAHMTLNASSCSIIIIDKDLDEAGFKKATLQAGTSYNEKNISKIHYRILPSNQVEEHPSKENKIGLTGWVISTGRAFLSSSAEDLANHPHALSKGVPQNQTLSAYLAVPLRNPRGNIIGGFKAERVKVGKPFSVYEQMLLETIAQLTGRCIAHLEDAHTGNTDTAVTAWVLDIISEAVSGEGELDAFLDIVVQAISAATLADSCAVFLRDDNMKTLTQRAGCGHLELRRIIRSYKLPDATEVEEFNTSEDKQLSREQKMGLTSWIASTGKSFYARNFEDLSHHPHHLGKYDDPNFPLDQQCGAWFGVPLRVGGTIIGVLKIENMSPKSEKDTREFSEETRNRLEALAQNTALAIERLQFQSPSRYQIILNARATIFGILRGDLNVNELVEKIVYDTAKLFNARSCALFLKEGNQLIQPPWAAVGWAQKGPKIRKYDLIEPEHIHDDPTPDQKVGLTVWIAVKRAKFTAKSNLELTLHPHHRGTYDKFNFESIELCESFMGVPLIVGDELLGVLKVETKMKIVGNEQEFAYFNEQDELVFEFIANSAAIAIKNARLIESRLLADKILAQPNANGVMKELYEFIQGRAEVLNTLDSTVGIVSGKGEIIKAKIIENLTALLVPKFFPAILKDLSSILDNPLKGLLEFVESAIRVDNLLNICNLPEDRLSRATILRKDFFLHDFAEVLLNSWEIIVSKLKLYEEDQTQRSRLQECLILVEEKEKIVEEMNLFEKSMLESIFSHWKEVIQITLKQFHPIPNPYIAGLPLPPGSNLFVGRRDIFDWLENKLSHEQNNVLVLHGGGRTGKTSILKHLQAGPLGKKLRERNKSPIFPIFIDLHKLADQGTKIFLLSLAQIIISDLQEQGVKNIRVNHAEFKEAHYRAFDHFLKKVVKELTRKENGILVVMLDEFETLEDLVNSKKVDKDIFKYFRSLMQHQPTITFILAGHHSLEDLSTIYKDLIFNVAYHKEIGFLNKLDAKKLITDPVKELGVLYEDRVIAKILHLTGGHPYFIQQVCLNCIDLINEYQAGYTIQDEHLNRATEMSLGPGSTITLEQLWETAGEEGQAILKSLAYLVGPEAIRIDTNKIIKALADEGKHETQIKSALDHLVKNQLLICDHSANHKSRTYYFAIDLLRLFVIRK